METRAYVEEAEDFLSSLTLEYFEHGAGLKGELEISPIYQRHHRLFELEPVSALLSHRETREERYLAHFAVTEMMGSLLRESTQRIATAEAQATLEWDGSSLPYRQAGIVISNEPDIARRRALERRVVRVTAALNPERTERLKRSHRISRQLGFADYVVMSDTLGGLDLDFLSRVTQRLLMETGDHYLDLLRSHLAAAGVPPEEATTGDWGFVRRGRGFDPLFRKEDLLPALIRTLADLGIDLGRQSNLKLDLEERPLKSPRAFCAPIRVPQDVRLVIRPRGGHDDYQVFFHEAGHCQHFVHTRADAPFAYRCLGDNSVTEAYAFLIGNLTSSRDWLRDVLGLDRMEEYLALAKLVDLYYLRRYAAKLAYELELHRHPEPESLGERYAGLLRDAVQLQVWPENSLHDVDDFFYCACYLRAWIFEVQLRQKLLNQFGPRWFAGPAAGDFLKELWSFGQEFAADEIAQHLGYPGLDPEPLITDLLADPQV